MNIIEYIKKHKEIYLLIFYFVFILLFGIIQKFYVPANSHLVTMSIDYLLPYNKYFFIFYAFWWPLVPCAFIFFYFRDLKSFNELCFQIFTVCYITLIIYVIYPSYLDLRETIVETDIFSNMIMWLRSIDPPRNVCPSLHVSETLTICLVVSKSKDELLNIYIKLLLYIIGILITLSTLFIDQHSIIDIISSIVLSVIAFVICPKFKNNTEEI